MSIRILLAFYHKINAHFIKDVWVFGNLRGRGRVRGYLGGGTTKIPPYLPPTPAIPREPDVFN
jgi:hypothetical protein